MDYYTRNKDFLQPWMPTYHERFFTLDFHKNKLLFEEIEASAGNQLRFFLFAKPIAEKPVILGNVTCSNIIRGPLQSCFLGYNIDQAHNGNGYASEAMERLLIFLFEEIGLHRVEANVIPRNQASICVLEKCGFQQEGLSTKYLKINGICEDHYRYAKINS